MIRFISYFIQFIIGLLLSLLSSSCHYKVEVNDVFSSLDGSEKIISETRTLSNFEKIKVSQAIQVDIIQSETFEVVVETNDNIMKHLKTVVSNAELKIYYSKKFNSFNNVESRVKIKMPHIKQINASSASNVTSKGVLSGENLQVSLSSAATVNLNLQYDNLAVHSSSASSAYLDGMCLNSSYEASSASTINAEKLKSNNVEAKVSSAGIINCWPILKLSAKASSGGKIHYFNSPQEDTKIKTSSGGSVNKK